MNKTKENMWEVLQNPPKEAENIADLILWSMNYDLKTGTPYHIFLDLIGYSDDLYGTLLFNGKNFNRVLGYMELDYLGDALKEYATNPQAVLEFIGEVDELDRGE
jgi:hypothetical protein